MFFKLRAPRFWNATGPALPYSGTGNDPAGNFPATFRITLDNAADLNQTMNSFSVSVDRVKSFLESFLPFLEMKQNIFFVFFAHKQWHLAPLQAKSWPVIISGITIVYIALCQWDLKRREFPSALQQRNALSKYRKIYVTNYTLVSLQSNFATDPFSTQSDFAHFVHTVVPFSKYQLTCWWQAQQSFLQSLCPFVFSVCYLAGVRVWVILHISLNKPNWSRQAL